MIDSPLGRMHRCRSPARWRGAWAVLVVLVWGLAGAGPAEAQTQAADTLNLIDRYRTARIQALARQALRRGWTARALSPDSVPVRRPALLQRPDAEEDGPDDTAPRFRVDDVRAVQRLERGWFEDEHGGTDWSFLGASTHLTFFDTTYTRDLRARLQAQFGDPTQTLADRPDTSRIGEAQFEYWFVVNDSIPVRITDANGPRDRGLIVATESRLRDRLPDLRAALLRPLRQPERAPYVDYYYDTTDDGTRRWYRAGFDGRAFFLDRIPRSEIVTGRRPAVEPVAPADSASNDSGRARPK